MKSRWCKKRRRDFFAAPAIDKTFNRQLTISITIFFTDKV